MLYAFYLNLKIFKVNEEIKKWKGKQESDIYCWLSKSSWERKKMKQENEQI